MFIMSRQMNGPCFLFLFFFFQNEMESRAGYGKSENTELAHNERTPKALSLCSRHRSWEQTGHTGTRGRQHHRFLQGPSLPVSGEMEGGEEHRGGACGRQAVAVVFAHRQGVQKDPCASSQDGKWLIKEGHCPPYSKTPSVYK